MNSLPYTIAVDFDMTLAITDYPKILQPKLGTINKLLERQQEGVKVILWTCREGEDLKAAVEFCAKYGLIFDKVNENIEERSLFYGNDSRKIGADEYWDDKAVKIY